MLVAISSTSTGIVVHSFAPPVSPHPLAASLQRRATIRTTKRVNAAADASEASSAVYLKDKLVSVLTYFHNDPKTLRCGLECTDEERDLVTDIIAELLALDEDPDNLTNTKNGRLAAADVVGTWDLLYTSSRIMVSNKSLSGLGHTASSMAQFSSLTQKVTGSQFLGFIEYTEKFRAAGDDDKESSSAFDVTISGEWMLEYQYTDPFTGAPTTAIRVDPEKVMYGPTTNDGNMWASLGPIKLLNICYLTHDLQIARGNANPDSIFVFQKSQ
jgi:hypothetical protein